MQARETLLCTVDGGSITGKVRNVPKGWEGHLYVIAFTKTGILAEQRHQRIFQMVVVHQMFLHGHFSQNDFHQPIAPLIGYKNDQGRKQDAEQAAVPVPRVTQKQSGPGEVA